MIIIAGDGLAAVYVPPFLARPPDDLRRAVRAVEESLKQSSEHARPTVNGKLFGLHMPALTSPADIPSVTPFMFARATGDRCARLIPVPADLAAGLEETTRDILNGGVIRYTPPHKK